LVFAGLRKFFRGGWSSDKPKGEKAFRANAEGFD